MRIEHLWVEVTRDFGSKWMESFYELEAECGLDPDTPGHVWLLHCQGWWPAVSGG